MAEHWHWDGNILKQINATTAETSDPITPYQRTGTSPSVMVRPNQDEESEEGAQRESSHCMRKAARADPHSMNNHMAVRTDVYVPTKQSSIASF